MKDALNNIRISINNFKWQQLFNDSQGKTDAALFCGVVGFLGMVIGLILIGTIFLYMVMTDQYNGDVSDSLSGLSVQYGLAMTICAGLIGLKTASKDKPIMTGETQQQTTMATENTPEGEKTTITKAVIPQKSEGEI